MALVTPREKKLWLALGIIATLSLLIYATQTIPFRNLMVEAGWQHSLWSRNMTENCMNDCIHANLTFLGYNPELDENMCLCWNTSSYIAEDVWK